MSALLNGVPLNGRVPSLWAEGQSTAESSLSAVPLRAAYTASAEHTAEATSSAIADRTAWPADVAIAAEAEQSAGSVRHAYLDGDATAETGGFAFADRTAWMVATTGVVESVLATTPVRWRLAFASSDSVSAFADDEELAVIYRITRVRDTRGIARTALDEGSLERILVNQVYTSGTCIARSGSSGLANTQIAFGTAYAESVNTDENLLVNIARSMRGTITAECTTTVAPHQIHVGNSIPAADAHVFIAPDILRADGSNERYAWAKPVAQTVFDQVEALAIRVVFPEPPELSSRTEVTGDFFIRGVESEPVGLVSSLVVGGGARVNHWQFARATTPVDAASTAVGDRLAWVGAFGESDSYAETTSASVRYTWEWLEDTTSIAEGAGEAGSRVFRPAVGGTTAEAALDGVSYKVGGSTGSSTGVGQTVADTIIYHWEWFEGVVKAEAFSVRADGLRRIKAVPTKPIYAEAFAGRVYFRLNAGAPAPDRRTIYLAARKRLLAVSASSREFVVI